jgi:hypothetical protein
MAKSDNLVVIFNSFFCRFEMKLSCSYHWMRLAVAVFIVKFDKVRKVMDTRQIKFNYYGDKNLLSRP